MKIVDWAHPRTTNPKSVTTRIRRAACQDASCNQTPAK